MGQFPELNCKSVVVRGSANGIGAATARSFHQQGARVFFCDTDAARGPQLVKELGPNVFFDPVDLADVRQIVVWVQRVKAAAENIRVLVNHAARDPRIPLLETTAQQWNELFAVNARAGFFLARACVSVMPPFL